MTNPAQLRGTESLRIAEKYRGKRRRKGRGDKEAILSFSVLFIRVGVSAVRPPGWQRNHLTFLGNGSDEKINTTQ